MWWICRENGLNAALAHLFRAILTSSTKVSLLFADILRNVTNTNGKSKSKSGSNEWLLTYLIEQLPNIMGNITDMIGQCYMIIKYDQNLSEYMCGLKKMTINTSSSVSISKLSKRVKVMLIVCSVSNDITFVLPSLIMYLYIC